MSDPKRIPAIVGVGQINDRPRPDEAGLDSIGLMAAAARAADTDSADNRPIAFPYTKFMVANSSVNQGAAYIVTSLKTARKAGVPEGRLVYVWGGAAAHDREDPLARASWGTPEVRGALISTPDGGFAGFVEARRRKPWIAAVRVAALAGGCELCLACDMIVAADDSRFGLHEVKRGLMAAAGGLSRLPRAIPRHVALEMVATGDPIDAPRAYALGLLNVVAKPDEVLAEAFALARRIAVNAPLAVQESVTLAREAAYMDEAEAGLETDAAMARLRMTEDFREGPRAFVEKRAPVWTGR